jgi:hypothetical protein
MSRYSCDFRIFISSTFTDFVLERNALQEFVFPRVKELAKRHGGDFQAIDLRWGISNEASLNQQTTNICFGEIERCQKVNSRFNFIALIGDRFGSCQLPYCIPADEFEAIYSQMSPSEQQLLFWTDSALDIQSWYRKDENAIPAEYVLRSRRGSMFHEYSDWNTKVQRPLLVALSAAAHKANLKKNNLVKYTYSVTWQEIAKGIFNVKDSKDSAISFIRSIENLNNLVEDLPTDSGREDASKARTFIDLDSDTHFDSKTHSLLKSLSDRLHKCLPGNVSEYKNVQWTGAGLTRSHIGSLPSTLEECLKLNEKADNPKTLCTDVWLQTSNIMLSEFEKFRETGSVEREREFHEQFGRERATKSFVGRTQILKCLVNYINREGFQHPLVIWGNSGSGKSAIMAKAEEKAKRLKSPHNVVSRYIGATPNSLNIRLLLKGLCEEISQIYGLPIDTSKTEFNEVVTTFQKCLEDAEKSSKKLIIFLDALDQLSSGDNDANKLAWMPAQKFENIRILVSTLPDEVYGYYQNLSSLFPDCEKVEVQPMSIQDGNTLLDTWLQEAKRNLTPSQKQTIFDGFSRSGLPLFLKLAFEEAKHWHSYDPLPAGFASDLDDHLLIASTIRRFFNRISQEVNHGPILPEYALCYLAASRDGISEDEIIEILSNDQDVMLDYSNRRSKYSPVMAGLPPIIWSRLYFDLEPYLNEQYADGTALLGFYHRQLKDVVEMDYLKDAKKKIIHTRLAEYWNGRKGTPSRKLSELPYHLFQLEKWKELSELLAQPDFFTAAYQRDKFDVLYFWSLIERNNPSIRRFEAYLPIIQSPHFHPDVLIENLTEMLQKSFDPSSVTEMDSVISLRKYLVEKYRKANDYEKFVMSLNQFSEFLTGRDGYFTQGIELALEAEKISRNCNNRWGEQKAIGNQAKLFASTIMKYRDSYLGISYRVIQPGPDFPMDVDVGRTVERALQLTKKREAICAEINYPEGKKESRELQAFILHKLGYLFEAFQLYKQQYKEAELANNPEVMAQSRQNMAEIRGKYRQIDPALEDLKKALEIAKKYKLGTIEQNIICCLEQTVKISRPESNFYAGELEENDLDWFRMEEAGLMQAFEYFSDSNIRDKNGRTIMMAGAERGSLYLVTEMMKRFADFNAHDKENQTALSIAKRKNYQQIVLVLVEKGAKE